LIDEAVALALDSLTEREGAGRKPSLGGCHLQILRTALRSSMHRSRTESPGDGDQ
jgi:hypothetical protein